jgi:sterol desaturase/sphingolipid hydroxylase (fatty acid hydroxylase superfamily)
MLWIIFGVAFGCIVVERLWPANELPHVHGWWARIVLVNAIQLGLVLVTGLAGQRYLPPWSIFHFSKHLGDLTSGGFAYLVSTFVYYWWHRYRHESPFFWRVCHQLHHSARRIEIVTSFYKHPVEIFLNSLLSSVLVYLLLGCSPRAAAICTVLAALGEYFYHWNIRTPRWLGFLVQRPESHRIHHQFQRHTNNFADLPLWDALFGTLQNAVATPRLCGFEAEREERFEEMLRFRDVHAAGGENSRPLQFLPTCIGCRKRWACAAAKIEVTA